MESPETTELDESRITKGVFDNRQKVLPEKPPGHYKESDVWPGSPGDRGPERLVFGADGEVYYSPDHYTTFVRIR